MRQDRASQEALTPHLTIAGHRTVQGAAQSIHINSHMGRFSSQVKSMPRSNVSKGRPGHRPPQCLERLGIKKDTWEALSNRLRIDLLMLGPH
jgi:hypothetical protein